MFDTWLKSGGDDNYMVWRDFRGDTGDRTVFLGEALRSTYLYTWAHFVREVYRNRRAGEPKDLQLADGSHVKLRPDHLAKMTAYIEPGNPIFELSLDALERINAIARSHGTHVIVVLQPSKEETYLPLLDGTPADPGAPLRAALAGPWHRVPRSPAALPRARRGRGEALLRVRRPSQRRRLPADCRRDPRPPGEQRPRTELRRLIRRPSTASQGGLTPQPPVPKSHAIKLIWRMSAQVRSQAGGKHEYVGARCYWPLRPLVCPASSGVSA